jgi:hypothetical protein
LANKNCLSSLGQPRPPLSILSLLVSTGSAPTTTQCSAPAGLHWVSPDHSVKKATTQPKKVLIMEMKKCIMAVYGIAF